MWASLALLAGGLALVSISGFVLTGEIERVSQRFGLAAGLLGIVSALGADAPEISSAVSAIAGGHHELGVGAVLGSNVYNLAALLGLSALVARRGLRVRWRSLVLNAVVALYVTGIAAMLVFHWIGGWLALALVGVVLVVYAVVESLHRETIEGATWLPDRARTFLAGAQRCVERDTRRHKTAKRGGTVDGLAIIPALAAIVLGSVAMVNSAVDLGRRWGIPESLVGIFGLAVLTGVPNTIAALQLARHGRGAAVVSEALNSNSLNVVFGICLPAAIVGFGKATLDAGLALAWLAAMIIAAVAFGVSRGLGKKGGVALLVLYAGFASVVLATTLA